MNISSIRKRRLVSSRDSHHRNKESVEHQLAAKLDCYTPIIAAKSKKTANSLAIKKTENGTFIMQLSEEPSHQVKKTNKLGADNGFKKIQDRPSSKKQQRKTSGILKTCFLPNPIRPNTSKGSRIKSCYFESSSKKKRITQNEEVGSMGMSLIDKNEILKEMRCPQSSEGSRKRIQSHHHIEHSGTVDQEFLSLFAK